GNDRTSRPARSDGHPGRTASHGPAVPPGYDPRVTSPGLRRLLLAAAAALVALAVGPPAAAQQAPGWRSQAEKVPARYTIDAKLLKRDTDDSPRLIRGNETIVFTNPSSREPIESLWFHLYANAF